MPRPRVLARCCVFVGPTTAHEAGFLLARDVALLSLGIHGMGRSVTVRQRRRELAVWAGITRSFDEPACHRAGLVLLGLALGGCLVRVSVYPWE